MAQRHFDIAIIGAGMAGASLAAAIGPRAKVVVLEAEAFPGYHSTGRSAAFWSETYGGPAIQPLTTASESALSPFLKPRGCYHIAEEAGLAELDALAAEFAGSRVRLDWMDRDMLHGALPGLDGRFVRALSEPTCQDIDVAGLHQHSIKTAKSSGAEFISDARISALSRDMVWRVEAGGATFSADIVVNAAGAWASDIARLAGASPIDITPYRRTVVQLLTDPEMAAHMPLVMDALGRFYFKPEAGGRLWLSPHDEHFCAPQDAAPEELDIAVAIDRFEHAVDWRIVKRERAWAGLRSFASDRLPVYGFDGKAPGFFWFAGQGGFGIQTAPAAADVGASLLLDSPPAEWVSGIDAELYSPKRITS